MSLLRSFVLTQVMSSRNQTLIRNRSLLPTLTLAIDVGNSRIKFGLFEPAPHGTSTTTLPDCVTSTAVPSDELIPWEKIAALVDEHAATISSAVVAGPKPAGVEMLLATWPVRLWPQPRVVRGASELPLRISVEFPDKVGIDRLLNAVAANLLRPADRAAIVVSAGTATTIDLVTADGTFAGGAILPGVELGARALHQYTALLPLIDVPDLRQQNVSPLGRDTRAAISSGLWFGQLGAIREIVTRLSAIATAPPMILVTGGNGQRLATGLGPEFRFESHLALRGLATVADAASVGGSTIGQHPKLSVPSAT